MIGIARRLESGPIESEIQDEYDILMGNQVFRELIYSQTSHLDNIRQRIDMATRAFSSVE